MMVLFLPFLFFVRVFAVAPFDVMPPARSLRHGRAMVLAAGGGVTEQAISKVMHHESGGWVDARPGMRHWPHRADLFPKLRHYVCGVMQNTARTAAECVAWQNDLELAYRAAADHMRAWLAFCAKAGRKGARRYRCADAGYALGVAAARAAT